MTELGEGIIVGVLGQWASGKSTAARTLVEHLGGKGKVLFLTDRALFAGQAIKHILESEASKVSHSIDPDGRQRFVGELATVWLGPDEDLGTVDPTTLDFDVYQDAVLNSWRKQAKVELGHQIRKRSTEGVPIVFEAAFGPNIEPTGEFYYGRTIPDLIARLEGSGVEPRRIKWIIIEACQAKRAERNRARSDKIPDEYFARLDAVGGDLEPDQQRRLEQQGTAIRRVPNEHDDLARFKAEVIAAYGELCNESSRD
jgi:hypothetical protein